LQNDLLTNENGQIQTQRNGIPEYLGFKNSKDIIVNQKNVKF